MKVVLLSTYDLGRQPFGLASPAAWLKTAGAEIVCADLSLEELPEDEIRRAGLVAFFLPMHTATRLAAALTPRITALNPRAHLCFYGLYAPLNEAYLRSLGGQTILGGEFEAALTTLYRELAAGPATPSAGKLVSLERLQFLPPERSQLPQLGGYAAMVLQGTPRITGYTEASRGCKHLCRHCPIVPVYNGAFRIVQPEVVLEDIASQVAQGAEHITFGDPDFLNGPGHALRIARDLHRRFPALTYDVTIKVEHLLKHQAILKEIKETGCILVTSAVESLDDQVLERLQKGHTCRDFLQALELMRETGLALNPTWVAFHPWTTLNGYVEFLETLAELDLATAVSPVQLAVRLLLPQGSLLLELPEVRAVTGAFDTTALCHPWRHQDPRVDALAAAVHRIAAEGSRKEWSRPRIFTKVWEAAATAADLAERPLPEPGLGRRMPIEVPFLTEPWYC